MIITVPKIGTGTELDPFRPDTTAKHWQVVEEGETGFVIEVFN
jgi:hypothetical protein